MAPQGISNFDFLIFYVAAERVLRTVGSNQSNEEIIHAHKLASKLLPRFQCDDDCG